MSSPITWIPSELFLSIISYLSIKDIGSLSVTSKAFRLLTIARIFSGAKLCPGSITAFRDGGSLSRLGPLVERLTLDTANSGFRGPDAICTFTRSCIENADLDTIFPNVTHFKIVFTPEMCTPTATFDMDKRILRSTLLGLSKFSLYRNLKSLVFLVDMPGEGGIRPTVPFDAETYHNLTDENWKWIGSVSGDELSDDFTDSWRDSEGLFPHSLVELGLVTPPRSRYDLFISDNLGPGLLGAATSVANSLEKLIVSAVPPIFRSGRYLDRGGFIFPDVVYNNVKEFSLRLDTILYRPHLLEAVQKVPNVERLELKFSTLVGSHLNATRERLTIRFMELAALKRLKKAVIEAPMRDEIVNLDAAQRGARNKACPAGDLSIVAVVEAVTLWLNSGMNDLESVEFRLFFIPKRRLDFVFEMLELYCDVVRGDDKEKKDWRLEWRTVKRKFEKGEVQEGNFTTESGFNREEYFATAAGRGVSNMQTASCYARLYKSYSRRY
ncbi:hypothetical protein TWF481_012226 [Arthrobotrys musiformis]|uniref:F-box domain-containing protein n=1 Tax=Arthrobotrys musiformis TaxID=47236 RepID=A0AAV9VWJ0_9PEZI